MEPEFKAGDIVTFNAYNEPIEANVINVSISQYGEPEYHLRAHPVKKTKGMGYTHSLVSIASGRVIKESKLFKAKDKK